MFEQTWKKYLPVIVILLKRSVNGEQLLHMNNTDFQRAAGGRKIKFSFYDLQLNDGRLSNSSGPSTFANEFAMVLQTNELTRTLEKNQQFEFSMNNQFQLVIKNITAATEPKEEELIANS